MPDSSAMNPTPHESLSIATTLPPKAQNLFKPAQHKIQSASWVTVYKPKNSKLKEEKKYMKEKGMKYIKYQE